MPKVPDVVATTPFLSVTMDGEGIISVVSTKKLIEVLDAFRERGKYPIFLANETIFSLKVALSMNTSFVTMLALYEVM